MNKFKVVASYTSYCMVEIEAEDIEQAWEIAWEMDGGSFTPMDNEEGTWCIEDVQGIETTWIRGRLK